MILYKTLAAATLAAMHMAASFTIHDPQHHEWAGVIVEQDGKYGYTIPQRGEEDQFSITVRLLPSQKLAAIYHTHPDDTSDPDATDMFSPQDIAIARQLNLPSFIWVQAAQHVREFIPGEPVNDILSEDGPPGAAPGRVISTLEASQ